jgi:mitochondrial enoyl-[acyl-carrier protein] reductase / trans-2-enoyl-CoA reductase
MQSRFLQFLTTGDPEQVLECGERELRPIAADEVRVAMRYAPINPADLNYMEGTYARAAHPPAIPGHEGVGHVMETGAEVTSLRVGDAVIPLLGVGCWAQHLTAQEQFLARLPPGIDLQQASMLRVNPVTAWHLLHAFTTLRPGDWVAQNAGNSGLGRAVIQIARELGHPTVSFVRRSELVSELQEQGADLVFTDDEVGLSLAKAALKGREPRLAGNAVGGDSAVRLMDLLAPEGTLVTYGAMSRRSLKVPNKFLIFKNLQLRGLWITRWLEQAGQDALFDVLHPLVELIANGKLHTPVDAVYPMSEYKAAMARAKDSGRSGKVLLKLD